jgi:hypothetical protein
MSDSWRSGEEVGVFGIPVMKLAAIGGIGFVAIAMFNHKDATASLSNPQCAFTVNADVLNVRAGPATTTQIVGRLVQSQPVTAQAVVQNGFRQLDASTWASSDYLVAASGNTC